MNSESRDPTKVGDSPKQIRLKTRSNTRLSRLDFASEVLIDDLKRLVAREFVTQFLRALPE
jgi:hypothetical protein